MKVTKRIPVWEKEEYQYQGAGGFVPNLTTYLHEDTEKRATLIICPGGGYFCVSPTEGELVAKRFFEKGYNCFVFTYTTNPSSEYPLMDQPLQDISRAIRYVRANAEEFGVDTNKVYICGFSAAGHLCASICDYHQDITDKNPKYQAVSNRPDAAILSYPVILSGDKAHQGSLQFLLGMDIYERGDEEAGKLLEHYSLEKHVTEQNPPAFLWHTITDQTVPVENSFAYELALREKGITHAMHLFSQGRHGLSVANAEWACKTCFGEWYTFDQFLFMDEAIKKGELVVSKEQQEEFPKTVARMFEQEEPDQVYPEVMTWPDLADDFLKELEK